MRRNRKFITVGSFSVVLLLAVLEVAGVTTFYVTEHQLFYRRSSLAQPPPVAIKARTTAQLHPILGFTRRPGLPIMDIATRDGLDRLYGPGLTPPWSTLSANNFGFFSEHDYPYRPSDRPYLIGVFGGSVAQWFSLQGAPVLIDRLQHLPGVENRRIEVLNFAQGGYKQPQQLQILAYFLSRGQPLDFVLNIDGFNEVALSLLNVEHHIDPSLPTSQLLLPLVALLERTTLSLEQIETFAQVKRSKERLKSLEAWMAHTRSAGVWLVLKALRQHAARRYSTASGHLSAGMEEASPDLIYLNPWSEVGESEEALDLISSTWMRASMLMDSMLRARGIPYLHVIQPNQYFSQKTFTDEERRVAISPDSPYAKNAGIGYPRLLEQIPAMQSQGVNIVSAVDLFDATPQTVYADNSGHFNQFGNEIFARFIADHMVSLISSQ